MKPVLGPAALTLVLLLAGCGSADGSGDGTGADTASDAPLATPSTPEESAMGSMSPMAEASSAAAAAEERAKTVACLSGKTWHLSTADLASQMEHTLSAQFDRLPNAGLDSVRIPSGGITVAFTPDLHATYTDTMRVQMKAHLAMGDTEVPMLIEQKHRGSSSGSYKLVDGSTLNPEPGWSGHIKVVTTTTIGGRSGTSPISVGGPSSAYARMKMVFSCEPGTLMMTLPGTTPFNYLFH